MAFNGGSVRAKHVVSWNCLRALSRLSSLPWLCIGDYNNDILHVDEKLDGNPQPQVLIDVFRSAVEDCQSSYLTLHGFSFTWECGCGTEHAIFERLDRAMVIDGRLNLFPNQRFEQFG